MGPRARRALSITLVLAVGSSCAVGAWWLIPSEDPVARVTITIELPGANAEEVDRTIAIPLAEALSELAASEVTITSSEGLAHALVELPGDGTALARVQDRVAAMTLPESTYPRISQAPSGRSVRWLLRGEHAAERQRLVRARLSLFSRGEVRTCAREEEVHVNVDPDRAAALGLSAAEVATAIRLENVGQPGGHLVQGAQEYLIRGQGGLDSLEAIGDAVVAIASGTAVRVRDVATVSRAPAPGCACLVGGEPCASGAATVADVARARDALRDEPVTWVDAALLFSVPAGTPPAYVHEVGASLARSAARVPGVVEVAIEVEPPMADLPADLALLMVFERGVDPSAILAALRNAVRRAPGVLLHPPAGAAEVVITGDDLDVLVATAGSVSVALEGLARVVAFGVARAPEHRVEIDRARAARLGVTDADLADVLGMARRGELATHYREGQREVPVRVRTDGELDQLRVSTAVGSVPIHDVATIVRELAPPVLYRCGAQRCVRLAIDGDPEALEQAEARLASIDLPVGVALRWRDPAR